MSTQDRSTPKQTGITLTPALAFAAACDAANARMRKAGRTKWNRADYNAAARTQNRLVAVSGNPLARLAALECLGRKKAFTKLKAEIERGAA